jgi:N-acetylmuramic acid 6-phosphate etherase
MNHRGHLSTEQRNANSTTIDRMSVSQAFDLVNSEDATIASAVARARGEICEAIALVVNALRVGGRLIYVGAGTSGRLGILDATECPPTFLTNPEMVQGVIAGGSEAIIRSVEGAEDFSADGVAAIGEKDVGVNDVVFGIATGGTTPFVHGAIAEAKRRGAKSVFFACVPVDQVADKADVSIRVITGPEVITGSTRMKAGTATKMVLNMVTTIAMVQLGKVYQNLMVDVNTTVNAKLVDRGTRMIEVVTGVTRDDACELLQNSGGRVKVALVMHARGVDPAAALNLLAEAEGRVGDVLSGAGSA